MLLGNCGKQAKQQAAARPNVMRSVAPFYSVPGSYAKESPADKAPQDDPAAGLRTGLPQKALDGPRRVTGTHRRAVL